MNIRNRTSSRPMRQQGYTLMEILVALFIGVFLLVGLFTILQNTRRSSSNQTALTQLQDEQRMAMSMLTDVIQNAGYFDPNTITSGIALPAIAAGTYATASALVASQGLTGSDAAAGDTILARYASNGNDGLINCNGATAAVATPTTWANTFYIQPTTVNGVTTYALNCSTDGTNTNGIPLVPNVQNMQIYYGVATVAAANNVDTYMTATQVQASTGGWASVTSVKVILSFVNPLYNQAGYTATTARYVYLTRVIPLQGRTGVIATAL